MNISKTILEQLGGGRFMAMTGSTAIATSTGLVLKLGGISKASAVEINLDAATDTYEVQAYHGRGINVRAHGEPVTMVHADQLRGVFTEMTGLATSL